MSKHRIIVGNSMNMSDIPDKSINLIVTSPPYPMIEMWDSVFEEQYDGIDKDLSNGNGMSAFHKMHEVLNKVWVECDRVLADSGFVCINIGDATRTINGNFQLYSNHTQIINQFLKMGYSVLPDILWRKQSNAPNKFMGSGMLPAGAYVTYEHEYILIFRKGGKRSFNENEKKLRQKSAFFWEERNVWFSDLWEIKGTSQKIQVQSSRSRNASFPFEIPYRLINMYSIEGDYVLDPFVGLGTTVLASIASNRNSYGVEIDYSIADMAIENIKQSYTKLPDYIDKRIDNHIKFINSLSIDKLECCYINKPYNFEVKTRQETSLKIDKIANLKYKDGVFECDYI